MFLPISAASEDSTLSKEVQANFEVGRDDDMISRDA